MTTTSILAKLGTAAASVAVPAALLAGAGSAALISTGTASAAPGVHINVDGRDVVKWGTGATATATEGNSAVAINFGRGSSHAEAMDGTGNLALAVQNSTASKTHDGNRNVAAAAFGGSANVRGQSLCLTPQCSTTLFDAGDNSLAIAVGDGAYAADMYEGRGNRTIAIGRNATAVTESNNADGNTTIALADSEVRLVGGIGDNNVSFAQCGASSVSTSGNGEVRTHSGNCLS